MVLFGREQFMFEADLFYSELMWHTLVRNVIH